MEIIAIINGKNMHPNKKEANNFDVLQVIEKKLK